MTKWRVQYKAPDGATEAIVELDVSTAKDARRKILDGECDLTVALDALIAVEKVSDSFRIA